MKELVGSFYFKKSWWESFERVSQFLEVSPSKMVERAILGKEKGYERAERLLPSVKEKISHKREKPKKAKKGSQKEPYFQQSLFDYVA